MWSGDGKKKCWKLSCVKFKIDFSISRFIININVCRPTHCHHINTTPHCHHLHHHHRRHHPTTTGNLIACKKIVAMQTLTRTCALWKIVCKFLFRSNENFMHTTVLLAENTFSHKLHTFFWAHNNTHGRARHHFELPIDICVLQILWHSWRNLSTVLSLLRFKFTYLLKGGCKCIF